MDHHHERHWNINASVSSMRARNFIREIVDVIKIPTSPPKPIIPLSIGDPTLFGNLPPPDGFTEEVTRLMQEGKSNGYSNALGMDAARTAIARSQGVTMGDVAITSGCSHALLLSSTVLCRPGSNMLVPSPGFSIYRTICAFLDVECRLYKLDPERNWEVDLADMERLVDKNTSAIMLNNPSNPCGSNWSRAHIEAIVALAERLRVPIISDEVYAGMVFSGESFHSVASVSKHVPVMICGGTAKQFMMPGWRVGWVVLHDRGELFKRGNIYTAVQKMAQTILSANSIAQASLPFLLERVPASYHTSSMAIIEANARVFIPAIAKIEGLSAVSPKGAMYCMVKIDLERFPSFPSEVEFSQQLLDEQQIFVLPGSCFTMPSYFRAVLCAPIDKLLESVSRLDEFCTKHRKH